MNKNIILTIVVSLFVTFAASAQIHIGKSRIPMFFDEYLPAKVYMSNGKVIQPRQANVFLKNATLLYKQGAVDMQANMEQIVSVSFGNVNFIKINEQLAYVVDSIIISKDKEDLLLCTRLIDMDAYQQQVVNSQQLTNLTLGDNIGMTTTDVAEADMLELPVVNHYYYRINGKFIKVHERNIKRIVSKEKYRLIRSITGLPDFSWGNEKFLIQILGIISSK